MAPPDRLSELMLAIVCDRWFEGVDVPALPRDVEQQARMLDNIAAAMTARAP